MAKVGRESIISWSYLDGRQTFLYPIMSGLPVIRPQSRIGPWGISGKHNATFGGWPGIYLQRRVL